ncbi:MAG: class I SAM-dependent methyltransferase [Parvibaculaceae bacterium]|nr:class I SAM-dependent methyltransferase [Parvibaculaceae bacterium]HBM90013.1 methyltransferase type 12 [Rhodobiaceae bacterium]
MTMENADFQDINEVKANMDHIYNQPDPRAYFRELKKLNYSIPDTALPIFRKIIEQVRQDEDDTVHVLDLGCSYGVNAALLKHDLSMDELYSHWAHAELAGANAKEVAARDKEFFTNLENPDNIEVIGLDLAQNAISFGEDVGLLDEGLAVNLETGGLPVQAREMLSPIDLVTSTGCIGYVTEKTFDNILPAVMAGRSPWIANFVLRMFPFDAIEETLADRGYVTEKLEGQTFLQRRFESDDEQEQALDQLREQGFEPTNEEVDGNLVAEFFLSRPKRDAEEMSLESLLAA